MLRRLEMPGFSSVDKGLSRIYVVIIPLLPQAKRFFFVSGVGESWAPIPTEVVTLHAREERLR